MAIEFTQISGAKSSTAESSIVRLDSVGVDLLTAYNGQSIDRNLTAEEVEVFKQFVNNENLTSLYAKVEGLADVVLTKSVYITQDSVDIISFSAVIMDCYLDAIILIYPEGSGVLGSIEISKRTLKIPKVHECPYFGDEIAQLINGGTVSDRKLTAAELEYFTELQDSAEDLRIKPSNFNMYMYFQKANYTKNFRLMYNTRYDSQVISIIIMFTTGMDSEDNTVGIIMSDLVTANDFENLEERVTTLEANGGGSSSGGGSSNNSILEWDFPMQILIGMTLGSLTEATDPLPEDMVSILTNNTYDIIRSKNDLGSGNTPSMNLYLDMKSSSTEQNLLEYHATSLSSGIETFSILIDLTNKTITSNIIKRGSSGSSGITKYETSFTINKESASSPEVISNMDLQSLNTIINCDIIQLITPYFTVEKCVKLLPNMVINIDNVSGMIVKSITFIGYHDISNTENYAYLAINYTNGELSIQSNVTNLTGEGTYYLVGYKF